MKRVKNASNSKESATARAVAEQIVELTDRLCLEHLDAEYGELCRKMVGKLARKRPSPLLRGAPRIWAGGLLYALGSINFLFDPSPRPHLTARQLSEVTGVPLGTLSGKARTIRQLLRTLPLDPEFCRRERLEHNPLAWLVTVDGILVDARMLPPELQAEA